MNIGKFFKKFGDVSIRVAPMVVVALGLPPVTATAITQGITIAQSMVGASNAEKAAKAAEIARDGIVTMNALAVQHGGHPVVDEAISNDALAQAIKITYDVAKLVHTANGDPMPVPGA